MSSTESQAKAAYHLALRRLAAREMTGFEIRAYLERKGVIPEEAEEVVEELRTEGLINEERYLRAYIRSTASHRKGPLRLLAALKAKGIELSLQRLKQVVGEELEEWDELEVARQFVARRYPEAKTEPKAYRRAFQALLRRGFSSETARKALASLQPAEIR